MPIIIRAEKVVNSNGVKCRKILDVAALSKNKLPLVYLGGFPKCYVHCGTLLTYNANDNWTWTKGELVSENEFQTVLSVVAEAGALLREANKMLADLRAEWNGEETFVI